MELLSSNIEKVSGNRNTEKNSLYFRKLKPEKASHVSGNGNPENNLYISGNGNPKKILTERNFLIFQETQLF